MTKMIKLQIILLLLIFIYPYCSNIPDYSEGNGSNPDNPIINDVQNISARAGNSQVVLTWTKPSDTYFDHVEITWSPDGTAAQTVANGFETCTVTGLVNNTEYTFTLKAVYTAGQISEGKTISAVPDGTAPDEIAGLIAVASPGYGIELSWDDPANSDFDHVEITWSPDGNSAQTVTKGTETFIAAGIAGNTPYTFTVKTVDNIGNTSTGTTINKMIACEVADLTADAVPGGEVQLNWTEPADPDFDHVEITWSPDGSIIQAVANGTLSFTTAELTDSTLYVFTVKTVDNAGNESTGTIVNATADSSAPAEVTGLNVRAWTGGTVVLNWTEPADADFNHVEITWTPGGAAVQSVAKGTHNFTSQALNNGTTYIFTVRTVDDTGNVSAGITGSATADNVPPAEITGLSITDFPLGMELFRWTDPTDADLFMIEFTWSPDDGSAIWPKGAETYLHKFTEGTTYTITIKTIDNAWNRSAGIIRTITVPVTTP